MAVRSPTLPNTGSFEGTGLLQRDRVVWPAVKTITRHTCFTRLLIVGLCLFVARVGQAQSSISEATPTVQQVQQGERLLRDHDARKAKQVLEQAVRRDPANTEAWDLLGAADSQLGLKQDAIRAYDNTLKLRPDDPLALYNLGALRLGQGRYEDAVRYLQTFHKLQPQDKSVLLALAHCFLSLGHSAEAQATINELLKASGNDPEVNLRAGELLLAHGEVQAALRPLGVAFHLRPGSDEARLMLAMARLMAPQLRGLEYQRVVVLDKLGRFQEAVSILKEVTARKQDADSLILLAHEAEKTNHLRLGIDS